MHLINKIIAYLKGETLITILNEDWTINSTNKRFKKIPNQGDLIYMENLNLYYEIIKVIFYINKRNGIFIVIKPILEQENEVN